MNRIILTVCCALTTDILVFPAAASASAGQRDLASDTLAIFSAKCAACHGPNLTKPKGRFGYVLDLARVAANREMVVPSFPDESELWELVSHGEMPPEDSPTGPLSREQKDVIRAWIAAGAPANSKETISAAPAPTIEKGHLRWLQQAIGWQATFLPFALAAMTAAWFVGLVPGLRATALRFPLAMILLSPTPVTLRIGNLAQGLNAILFLMAGTTIGLLCKSRVMLLECVDSKAGLIHWPT